MSDIIRGPELKEDRLPATRGYVKHRVGQEAATRKAAMDSLLDAHNSTTEALQAFAEALTLMSKNANHLAMVLVGVQARLDEYDERRWRSRARRLWAWVKDRARGILRSVEDAPPAAPALMVPIEAAPVVDEAYAGARDAAVAAADAQPNLVASQLPLEEAEAHVTKKPRQLSLVQDALGLDQERPEDGR